MVLFSPRPEQAQLSGSFKSLLLQHDVVLENILIPSPPMSPRFSHDEEEEGTGIVVAPHQADSLSSSLDFLSQYRHLGNTNSTIAVVEPRHTRSTALPRSSSHTNMVRKDIPERSSRRRVPRRNYRADLELQLSEGEGEKEKTRGKKTVNQSKIVPKPQAKHVVKPIAKKTHHNTSTTNSLLSSPIASARAVNTAPQYVPNMSWSKLVDYSPPLSTLPANNNKCLKIEWKGSSMDLSQDPLKDKLHPAELVLAETLRLPCDLYLDSKRRFFLEKVHKLKKGLPFRRTDAQKACRIDVNKASRLYAAFEKVNWLDDANFQKYL